MGTEGTLEVGHLGHRCVKELHQRVSEGRGQRGTVQHGEQGEGVVTKPDRAAAQRRMTPPGARHSVRDQAVPGHPRGGNQGRERPGLPLLPIPPPAMSPFAKPNRYHRARRPREGSTRDPERRGETGCPWTATPGDSPGRRDRRGLRTLPPHAAELSPLSSLPRGHLAGKRGRGAPRESPRRPASGNVWGCPASSSRHLAPPQRTGSEHPGERPRKIARG